MAKFPTRNYSTEEVRALVEGFEELREKRDTTRPRLMLLCRLVDIWSAIKRLGPHEYQAVLLVGLHGISENTAGNLLGVHQSTMSRRYTRALEELTTDLNGVGP
jgi:DNA-directed RNA polymerase specialized sigma24 family protein